MEDFNKENKYLRARERVENLKKFYSNLTSYVIVCSGLAIVNYYVNEWHYMWFLWVVFGWGIGIIFHAIGTFNLNPFFGRDWEERKLKEYMDKDREEGRSNRWE
ncbi:2TM domain-containing protein [Sungkyunkwania multivorans]|uniref:2TM domain-containing protein n=1 Tax=Sungkyunkwania multivorans TaxID=1173618 RepID=A0ABW3CSU3_9FLAO